MMETPGFKCIHKLIKITCILFTFPMFFACGAAIEPDGTITVPTTSTTGTVSGTGTITPQDSQGGGTGTTGSGENSIPLAHAGADKSVTVNTYTELDGSKSLDPDGDTITYLWTLVSSPAGSTASLENPNTVAPSFTPDVSGVYEIKLAVYDGTDLSPDVIIYVSVYTGNAAPVADAGPDQNTTTGLIVSLDSSGSSDFNNDSLSYNWTFSAVPSGSAASLTNVSAPSPTFIPDEVGTYELELIVNDGTQDSVADTMTVSAFAPTVNLPPVAHPGTDQSTGNYTLVTLDGSASTDPEFADLTYSWAVVSPPEGGSAPILSDSTSVTTTFTPDLTGTYVFRLTVSDGVSTSAANVSVSVSSLKANLSWTAPTTNADSTPLTDLAGYKISYGTSSGVYTTTKDIPNSDVTSDTISGLKKTSYYFVIRAYDLLGNESENSVEVSKTF